MSRAYTCEEIRDQFLKHVEFSVEYWDKQEPDKRKAMEGLAFSIMVLLDGGRVAIPGFTVKPNPHPSDQAFLEGRGENWFPDDEDIAGGLHELIFHNRSTP